MITSIFIAKFLGLSFIIVSLALLFSRKNFDLVLKLYENRISVLAKGVVNVILGIILLLFHNVWATNLDIAITLFCWLILVVGLINLFFPKHITGMISKLRKNKGLGTLVLVIVFLIGTCLVYVGFT